jgi:SAM-dependent MidA family methyltransferase
MTITNKLPIPDNIAQQHSDKLVAKIKQKIHAADGKISFADYMNLCLYAPGLGYYSAGSHKIGSGGDFTTAPEVSPLFSRSLAHHIKDVLIQLPRADILEFGAGSGKMAIDILLELQQINCLPEHYYIIEASADLRQKQQEATRKTIPQLIDRIHWLEQIPSEFNGVIVANEVCDAMPVHLLQFEGNTIKERYVQVNALDELSWCEDDLSSAELLVDAKNIQDLIADQDYLTEVNLQAQAWLNSIADSLVQGAMFIIDYGYSSNSYYHPDRDNGTLMCYYQHHGHDDIFFLPGLQDITAHVNFSTLAQTAYDKGLDVAAFQTQADFLIAGGIIDLASTSSGDKLMLLKQSAEIKRLTLPSEMGETFKVLSLTQNLDQLLPRLQLRDHRHQL